MLPASKSSRLAPHISYRTSHFSHRVSRIAELQRQAELRLPLAEGPRVIAPIAQVAGELAREAVQGVDGARAGFPHVFQEILVIGVIGQREAGIAPEPEPGARVHGPTRDVRRARS